MTEEKERLLKEAKKFSNDIKGNLDTIKTNVTSNGKHVALIGGVLLAGITLYRLLRSEESNVYSDVEEDEEKTPYMIVKSGGEDNVLLSAFKKIILDLLLSFAKQKLEALIKSYEK